MYPSQYDFSADPPQYEQVYVTTDERKQAIKLRKLDLLRDSYYFAARFSEMVDSDTALGRIWDRCLWTYNVDKAEAFTQDKLELVSCFHEFMTVPLQQAVTLMCKMVDVLGIKKNSDWDFFAGQDTEYQIAAGIIKAARSLEYIQKLDDEYDRRYGYSHAVGVPL